MRVFLAGATAAIGQQLVPLLQRAGHAVVGATRSPARAAELRVQGVEAVVLDAPAPVRDWLPVLAAAIGAPPPPRVPRWLVRMMIGEHAVLLMNDIRGMSNAKAKATLAWQPRYASWRTVSSGKSG